MTDQLLSVCHRGHYWASTTPRRYTSPSHYFIDVMRNVFSCGIAGLSSAFILTQYSRYSVREDLCILDQTRWSLKNQRGLNEKYVPAILQAIDKVKQSDLHLLQLQSSARVQPEERKRLFIKLSVMLGTCFA